MHSLLQTQHSNFERRRINSEVLRGINNYAVFMPLETLALPPVPPTLKGETQERKGFCLPKKRLHTFRIV